MKLTFILSLVLTLMSGFGKPAETKVSSLLSLQQAIVNAAPGDRIIVADGIYTAAESIVVAVSGTSDKPISIEADHTGSTEISGTNGFIVNPGSSYIVIKGFRFTHKTGTCRIEPGASHIILTRNLFECTPSESGAKPYLNVSGDDCEISFNTFQNKKDEGQMISVQGPGGNLMAKRTWIHHNYFFNFPSTGKNNCSAIQIGLSGRSMDKAFCIVEYNLFEKTEGENEGAICHKSCNNIIRYNTFGEKSEECSIRHGNNSQVYGNYFINTTGLRFSGDDHLIYANHFLNCSKAIVCTNGDGEVNEGAKLTCHDRPDRVRIVYNTITDCESAYQMPGRNNGLGATSIDFSDNLLRNCGPVSITGSYLNPVWKNNFLNNSPAGDLPESGYKTINLKVQEFQDMVRKDAGNYPEIPADNRPLNKDDVGFMAR